MLEILKAISYDSDIIIMDEPTSAITNKEVRTLFGKIKELKERGACIIYISHKMEEILAISDEVTIMRDGQWISTNYAKDLTTEQIKTLLQAITNNIVMIQIKDN